MAPTDIAEDKQREPEECAPTYLKKETRPSKPDQALAAPQSRLRDTLSNESYSAPKSLNPSAPSLDVLSSSSISLILPARRKKRDSDGEIKQLVAELNARTDLAISREKATTPEAWKFSYAMPSAPHWGNDLDGKLLRKYPSVMSYSPRSPQTTKNISSMVGYSKDVEEEHGQEDDPRKRKRQGSLLEWRNKEMFEEPVRI